MKKFIVLIFAAAILSGCALLERFTDKGSEAVAKGVTAYCKNTDEEFRAKFRDEVNAKAAPNSVSVTCQ